MSTTTRKPRATVQSANKVADLYPGVDPSVVSVVASLSDPSVPLDRIDVRGAWDAVDAGVESSSASVLSLTDALSAAQVASVSYTALRVRMVGAVLNIRKVSTREAAALFGISTGRVSQMRAGADMVAAHEGGKGRKALAPSVVAEVTDALSKADKGTRADALAQVRGGRSASEVLAEVKRARRASQTSTSARPGSRAASPAAAVDRVRTAVEGLASLSTLPAEDHKRLVALAAMLTREASRIAAEAPTTA